MHVVHRQMHRQTIYTHKIERIFLNVIKCAYYFVIIKYLNIDLKISKAAVLFCNAFMFSKKEMKDTFSDCDGQACPYSYTDQSVGLKA